MNINNKLTQLYKIKNENNTKPQNRDFLEFVITKDDLQDDDDDNDNKNNIEFTFFELPETKSYQLSIVKNEIINTTDLKDNEIKPEKRKLMDNTNFTDNQQEQKKEDLINENKIFIDNNKRKCLTKISPSSNNKIKENFEENDNEEDRCEDTIFGELVAAMIKKMPQNKRKIVKKKIMNILLS